MAEKLIRNAALLVLLAGLIPRGVAGQGSEGSLQVTVLGRESGDPVPGALVRVEGTPLFEVTDSSGVVRINGLRPGRYAVTATAAGFVQMGRSETVLSASGAASVEILLEDPVFDLPGLVVTATRGAARFGETSASVDVVSSEDLERLGAITLDEGLRYASGVVFNAGQLDIRGASGLARGVGSRVLMMLDGHRFLSGTTGEVNFETLPSLSTERVEVVKGPASTLYGSGALGGVVNVIRRPISDESETDMRVYLGVYDTPSEFDFTDQTLSYAGLDVRHARTLGAVGSFLEIGRRSSDGYRQNGGFEHWLFHGGLTLPRSEGPPLAELSVSGSSQKNDHFFTWRSENRPLEVEPQARGDRTQSDQLSVTATVTPVLSGTKRFRIRTGIYRAAIQNRHHDNEDYHRSVRYQTDVELALHRLDGHVFTVGAEGAYTPVTSNFLGDPSVVDAAAFLQDEVTLSDDVRFSAGLRLDHRSADPGSSETTLNPRVGLVWGAPGSYNARASVGRGYRAPSPVEQFVSTTQSGFDVIPNLDLRGESSWAFEIGATGRLVEWAWVDLGLFESRFDDLIEPSPVPGQLFTFQFRNVMEARVRGLDLSTKLGLTDSPLRGQLNYLFLDAEDLAGGDPLPYRSRHNVTLSVDYGPLGVDFQHRSRVEKVLAFPLDPREAVSLLDLRANFGLAGVLAQIKVANIFQETYIDTQERNLGPSRSVQLTLTSGM